VSRKRRWGRLGHVAEQDPGPAVQRIMLGCELRALREAAKISTGDAAAAFRWYRAKVSKVETGSATEIKLFFGDVIPVMFQTRDYARALLSTSVIVPPADVEQMATSREHRAERLRGGAPLLWVVLGKEDLRRTVGGHQVQREQLLRLRELAELPNVTV
jgi:Domain of unknown function (DUF5753)